MSEQSKVVELAGWLEAAVNHPDGRLTIKHVADAAKELRRLDAENAALRAQLAQGEPVGFDLSAYALAVGEAVYSACRESAGIVLDYRGEPEVYLDIDVECVVRSVAAPQQAPVDEREATAQLPPYNCFSLDDGCDYWVDCPDDIEFVDGKSVGDEFEVMAGWRSDRVTYRVTKVPDAESDDYEVERITPHPRAAIKPAQSADHPEHSLAMVEPAVPEGYQLVPIDATEEILNTLYDRTKYDADDDYLRATWARLIATAKDGEAWL